MKARQLLANLLHPTPPAPQPRSQTEPEDFTSADIAVRTLKRRAVEAAIWGVPLVSFDAMRQAFFRDAGAKYGDIVYLSKPADWMFQTTTPNASSLYVYFNWNTKDGPVVLDLPPSTGAGLFGSLLDAWQTPLADVGPEGEDRGEGGKYLLLPPGHTGDVPAGYLPLQAATFNGYALLRAIPDSASRADLDKAIDLVKRMRVYPLASAGAGHDTRHIDIAGKPFYGIAPMDDGFYDALARMVDEEPVQARDFVAMAQLRSLGIERGKVFKPDRATRQLFDRAIAEAHAGFMHAAATVQPFWPDSQWGLGVVVGPKTGFSFVTPDRLEIDERAMTFFLAYAAPKKLGAATFYVAAFRDARGQQLRGDRSYRLHVPPGVPVKQYWAVTAYDLKTAAFIRESPQLGVDSYQPVQKNPDGSIDVYFGPTAPVGREANWVYTAFGKPWFAFFRFYGPEQALFDKRWRLSEIAPI